MDLEVSEIDALGITISGRHFISKGTRVTLISPIIDEILLEEDQYLNLFVTRNWVEDNQNHMYLDFDSEDTELLSKVRTWIKMKAAQRESI